MPDPSRWEYRMSSRCIVRSRQEEHTMKVTGVRARRLTGTLEYEGEFREERQARPIDLYESMVTAGGGGQNTPKIAEGRYRMEAIFLEIETDEGVVGRAGTISAE